MKHSRVENGVERCVKIVISKLYKWEKYSFEFESDKFTIRNMLAAASFVVDSGERIVLNSADTVAVEANSHNASLTG